MGLYVSVLFDHLDLQEIEGDFFDKAVLPETSPAKALEFGNVGIQPDGLAQVKFITDVIQSMKNFVSAGVIL